MSDIPPPTDYAAQQAGLVRVPVQGLLPGGNQPGSREEAMFATPNGGIRGVVGLFDGVIADALVATSDSLDANTAELTILNQTETEGNDLLQALGTAVTGLASDVEAQTTAVLANNDKLDAQLARLSTANSMSTVRNSLLTAIEADLSGTVHADLLNLLAAANSGNQTAALILASDLRQEALLSSLATAQGAANTALTQAHADATAQLAAINATNAALAQAHTDALAEVAATQAAQAQAHTDAVAQAAALTIIHADDQATATALATLHTDDQGLQTALTSLISAAGTENATLSAISLADANVLATLKATLAGGTPFAATATTATTITLFQAGANGSVLLSLALVCPNLLSGVLSGLASVSVFYAASPTATSGTNLDVVSLASGSSLALNPNDTIPAGSYVRMTNATGAAVAFGARKDL